MGGEHSGEHEGPLSGAVGGGLSPISSGAERRQEGQSQEGLCVPLGGAKYVRADTALVREGGTGVGGGHWREDDAGPRGPWLLWAEERGLGKPRRLQAGL